MFPTKDLIYLGNGDYIEKTKYKAAIENFVKNHPTGSGLYLEHINDWKVSMGCRNDKR